MTASLGPPAATAAQVLIVTEQIGSGGKRSHVDALMAGLEAIGWHAALYDRNDMPLVERAAVAGPFHAINLIERGLGHRWLLPAQNRALERGLRRWMASAAPPALFHVQESTSFKGTHRAARGTPVAITVHGPSHREIASGFHLDLDHPTIRFLRDIEKHAYLEANAVISVDRAHADYVREFGRSEGIWVIPNFVDTRRFNPQVAPEPFSEDVEIWVHERPVLFCARRLVPKNGVEVAVRAASVLVKRAVLFALVIAGDGPQRGELETLVDELDLSDHAWFLGDAPLERMPGWCRRASVVVVPSVPSKGVEEATSIAVLEAQAAGKAVVASDLGGLREIVEDGATGLLTTPGDAERLAAQVERLLADRALADRLGSVASARVHEKHSHVAGAQQYAEVYRALGVIAPPG